MIDRPSPLCFARWRNALSGSPILSGDWMSAPSGDRMERLTRQTVTTLSHVPIEAR